MNTYETVCFGTRSKLIFPNYLRNKIHFSKNIITQLSHINDFRIIYTKKHNPIIS